MNNTKKGFTLAELLVVVAIIGVLVAVSIPIFTSQLSKARYATNQANLRAAKGAMITEMLGIGNTATTSSGTYDTKTGILTVDAKTANAGEITDTMVDEQYDANSTTNKISHAGTYTSITVVYAVTTATTGNTIAVTYTGTP